MSEEEIKLIRGKRRIIRAAVTRFETYLNSLNTIEIDIIGIKIRKAKFETLWTQFEQIQEQLELFDTAESEEESSNARDNFESQYFALITRVETLIQMFMHENSPPMTETAQTSISNLPPFTSHRAIRLPEIKLPIFSGSYGDWYDFYNTFHSLIHSNSDLSNIQKLQYLKATLQGEAAEILSSIEISDLNYDCAWDMLKQRYDNKRLIISKHIQAILDFPSMNKENGSTLRHIVDGITKHVRILKSLNRPVDTWDDILIHIVTNKLDAITIKEWESTLQKNTIPSLQQLTDFLTHKCDILETISRKHQTTMNMNNPPSNKFNSAGHFKQPYKQPVTSCISMSNLKCSFCNEEHAIYQCGVFLALSIKDRIKEVKNKNICINCLRKGHSANKCNSGSCRRCSKKHNTLLHLENSSENLSAATISNHTCSLQSRSQVLLSTALINIRDATGNYQQCRALLDSGSQSCFITNSLVKRLKLKKETVNIPVAGISQSQTQITSRVHVTIKSRFNAFTKGLPCLILNTITDSLPLKSFQQSNIIIPKNIKLADPYFHISNNIDLLIGAELFWDLLCVGQIKQRNDQPLLQKTTLGWIVSGKYSQQNPRQTRISCNLSIDSNLNNKLASFWELEEYSDSCCYSPTEQYCEDHFKKTFRRNNEGRYVVNIPLKQNFENLLGDSKAQAIKRFYSLERKLAKDAQLKSKYSEFINEYLSLGHMKLVPPERPEFHSTANFYLPHHAVLKQTSLTTKLRVVFDGSARSTTGVSLNDVQIVGPVLQQDLFSIVVRFRTHQYVMIADIAKMYRQVLIDESQIRLQRILWRENPSDSLDTYELTTVTYGTASASYLAIRALRQLAIEERESFPRISNIILRDFYVDDLLTGANTIVEAKSIQTEISTLLLKGGFELRKWISNLPEIIQNVSSNIDIATVCLDKDESIRTLGLQWNAHHDVFKFSKPIYERSIKITKRIILSNIARIFDPLGLIGPIIVDAKLIMQQLWQSKISWDESIPISIYTKWIQFESQLDKLNNLSIPRWVINIEQPTNIELHGFSDASEQAYGACIYIRTTDKNHHHFVKLLCSKSRIAPLKNISLPKLELCGALLLARLMSKVIKSIDLSFHKIYYWTDSTITLTWIKSIARCWKTFVANRVGEIKDLSDVSNWFHVATNDNPADVISRGASLENLINCQLWWTGPSWLLGDFKKHLIQPLINSENDIPEYRVTATITCATICNYDLFFKYSSLTKLLRISAYCLRFSHNIKTKIKPDNNHLKTGPLSLCEINKATISLIKVVQQSSFLQELSDLKAHKSVKGKLLGLNPFLDNNGLIRVGGRLHNSSLPYSQKHQIVLPKGHPFSILIIDYEHKRHLHAGNQATLAAVRKTYWPLGSRNMIRAILHKCITCFKANPRSDIPLMGTLPIHRVTPSRPFANCGVDYFGPLSILEGKRRNSKLLKAYGAIFICFSTKAVHLELATDLSTETFLAAMKRFIARRGKPINMYSDNGTNFTGANRELQNLHETLTNESSRTKIISSMSNDNVAWHFIPPKSPHFGGIWEAAVKSSKYHIRRIIGNAALTYEEMYTCLSQIEAILNSRPLTPISNDPNDMSGLTPGHFLIGDTLTSTAEPDIRPVFLNRLSQWQRIEQLRQHFWSRWSKEYLSQLQQRSKWASKGTNIIAPGQLVLIREDNIPPLRWPMGRVDSTHPGEDGIIRAATVRTSTGFFKRATNRLCPLPMEQ